MKSGIYKITNPEDLIYVGCSHNVEERQQQYQNFVCKTQPNLLESLIKYGWENHEFEILEYTDDLINKEKYYISQFNSYTEGLNGNRGGGGVTLHTDKSKKKISESSKKNKGKRVNSHWKGKTYSEEHKQKLSLSKKGKPSHWKGKTRSEENKLKISQSTKGKPKPANEKPILAYDKAGNFIAEYSSQETASKVLGGNPTAINNALKKGGNATSCSYIWRYKNSK